MKITLEDMLAWEEAADGRKEILLDWVRAHGLIPENILSSTGLQLDDGQIHFREFVRGPEGQIQLDENRDDVISVARSVPIAVPYPAALGGEILPAELRGRARRMEMADGHYRGRADVPMNERATVTAWVHDGPTDTPPWST